ncbi:nuclear transport factor 2 family protein [Sphingopyxis granuli]|uniref:nuclear transport factor 2 family protein n=1 Tax=Sphingopyxis granuli TaxID=267128 RepID=UPI00301E0AC8
MSACSKVISNESTEPVDEEAIRELLAAKADALVRRSADELAALIHADFVYVNTHFDRAGYVETYCRSGKVVFHSQQIDYLEVRRFPNFLVATMILRDQFSAGDREISATYRSLGVFSEENGKWLWSAGQTMSAG